MKLSVSAPIKKFILFIGLITSIILCFYGSIGIWTLVLALGWPEAYINDGSNRLLTGILGIIALMVGMSLTNILNKFLYIKPIKVPKDRSD